MSNQLPSEWAQIAKLRPKLRQHVSIYPQEYRGERWYVLHDKAKGRHLRFNAESYDFIGRLDGQLNVQQIWEDMVAVSRADQTNNTDQVESAPIQEEIQLLLVQLYAVDALHSDLPVDAKALIQRYQQEQSLKFTRAALNPLTIRIRLFDPDTFLNRIQAKIRPLFSRSAATLWCLLVGLAGLLAMLNFQALVASANSDILSPGNLTLMMFVFLFVKTVHEFAHAFAVKLWGGEVHEMGVSLLVFAPVPYVDASAAWSFREKRKRVLVSAVGIMSELFLAALGLFVWLMVEPGLVKDAAFNMVLIGSVSTLLFNANPLLRFDGYYILQDLIEIPNLGTRANRYYQYLIQRYLLGITQARSPVSISSERGWFLIYGPSAFLYSLLIFITIALFLAEEYLIVGILLGIWVLFMRFILPLLRGIRFLIKNPNLSHRRWRSASMILLMLGATAAGLFVLPAPMTTYTEGVVWVPDQAQVFAKTNGFVTDVVTPSGADVKPGDLLVRLHAPSLDERTAKLTARYRELEIRRVADQLEKRVQSDIISEEMSAVAAEIEVLREQAAELEVHSKTEGTFVVSESVPLKGTYVRKGQLIGYVIMPERLIVRTVVAQSAIGLVRERIESVEVRLAERLGETIVASVLREMPEASTDLPSRALGVAGGGDIAVHSTDRAGQTAVEEMFRLDLALPPDIKVAGVGERAYVRFVHGTEPLALQWLRSAHQLLLTRLAY